MNVRPPVLCFCLGILAMTVALVLFLRHPVTLAPGTSIQIHPGQNVVAVTPLPRPNASVNSGIHTGTPVATNAVHTPGREKMQEMIDVLSAKNDVPIVFYGRLEDQFGNPVTGAQIAASIRVYNGIRSTVERFSVASDENGLFQINHGTGESLGLMPRKTGYALATTGTEFGYSQLNEHPYVSDQRNPTVVKMWKLQGAEPLVGISLHCKLHYTDAPLYFDLLTGEQVASGGDIQLTVKRNPGVISGRNKLDWSVQVQALNGGLMDSGGQEAVTYAAPESGYLQSMSFIFSTNSPFKWAGGFDQGFFFTSRSGQLYGKLSFSFRINEDPEDYMNITFGGVANANGSRNWEGAPDTFNTPVN